MYDLILISGSAMFFVFMALALYFKTSIKEFQTSPKQWLMSCFQGDARLVLHNLLLNTVRFFRRCITSKFTRDILPSCLCFLVSFNWCITSEVLTGEPRSNSRLWSAPIFLAGLTSCAYLIAHNLNKDITFYPNQIKTFKDLIIYNVTRSTFHGLVMTSIINTIALETIFKHFPGLSLHHGLYGYPEDWAKQNSKCLIFLLIITAIWGTGIFLIWLALRRDLDAWEKDVEFKRGEEALRREERNLRWRLEELKLDLDTYQKAEAEKLDAQMKEVVKEFTEKRMLTREIPRLEALLKAFPEKKRLYRAKME